MSSLASGGNNVIMLFAVEKATYMQAMHRESNREDIELNINTAFVSFTRFPKIYWP